MLKKFLNRITRLLKSTKGYTLVEITAVVAVTGTLAAVSIPIAKDKIEQGKLAAAAKDVQTIAYGIMNIKGDTGYWPVFTSASTRKAGTALDVMMLSSVKGTTPGLKSGVSTWATAASADNTSIPASTPLTVNNPPTSSSSLGTMTGGTAVDAFEDHLVQNSAVYDSKNWNGPYLDSDRADPWGHKYLCNIGELYEWDSSTDVPTCAVIVISAGPNGIIETGPEQLQTAFTIEGDDITFRIQ